MRSFLQWRIMKSTQKSSEHFRGKHWTIFTISILKGNEGLAFVVLLAKSCSYVTAKCCMKIWEIGPNRLNSHGALLCYKLPNCWSNVTHLVPGVQCVSASWRNVGKKQRNSRPGEMLNRDLLCQHSDNFSSISCGSRVCVASRRAEPRNVNDRSDHL